MTGTRPSSWSTWGLLGAALALMLFGVWWFLQAPTPGDLSGDRSSAPSVAPGRAQLPGTGRERHAGQGPELAQGPAAPRVGGVIIAADQGPLTLGAIELWCDDGQLAARARVDEDGSFSAPACATTTCVRLRHPSFEQPIAWELGPNERREFTVGSAPGISGVVLSPLGQGVADASLIVRSDDGRRAAARTDAAGEFTAALPRLRPCDACDLERGSPVCSEQPLDGDGDHLAARVLVSAPEFAPGEFEVELELEPGAGAVAQLELEPPAAPITGVVRGADGALFDSRTKVLATNVERAEEQHHAQLEAGQFELSGLADARYRLRAIRDGREVASLDSAAPGDQVELRAEQGAGGIALQLEILDASARPVADVRVDGGPFVGAVSDAQGRVEAAEVAAGSYTLRLRAADCSAIRVVVDVTLARAGAMHQVLRLPSSCDPR